MPTFRHALLMVAVGCGMLMATSSAQAQTCAATVDKTVVICSPANGASVASPVQFTAAAKDNEANVTAMAVYVDGMKMATGQGPNFSASVTLSAGSHSFDVKAWDSAGASFASVHYTITVGSGSPPPPPPPTGSCSPPSTDRAVAICSPANNSTVASPVQFSAAARDNSHTVTAMAVYVDGTKKASSTSATLSASAALTVGAHSFDVKAWDSLGSFVSARYSITVTSGTTSGPTINISANPASVSPGEASTLTVTATNASTVTVKDNVTGQSSTMASTGGTLSVTPQQTTTYTATATDSNGAQATASATVTVGGAGDITAVNHIIFMLQENRSFDSYFGMLNPYRRAKGWNVGADGKTYDVDGIDDKLNSISNQNDEGQSFSLFHTTSSCLDDMTSAWLESYGDVSRYNFTTSRQILMDGFVHIAENFAKSGSGSGTFTDTTGRRAMAYYADTDYSGINPELSYYYFMASQFAISDRWFSPVSSKTIPNRIATLSGGTTQGYVYDPGQNDHAPQLGAETIFQLLQSKNISWKIYYGHKDSNGSPSTAFKYFSYSNNFIHKDSAGAWVVDSTHIAPLSQYYTDAANGKLPQFAYIEPNFGSGDEHPGSGQSILNGQQTVAKIINSLMYSPSWADSVFFFSFDEAGGPYDHVPPVPGHTNQFTSSSLAGLEGDISSIAVNPDGYLPCVPAVAGNYTNHCDLRSADPGAHSADAAAQSGFAAQLGFRVPNFVISPFVKKHYVGHAAMDHTAVMRFVEQRFGLPALTKRDAAQPNLLDFFDFSGKPWATPPAQSSVPAPPSVGGTCHADSF